MKNNKLRQLLLLSLPVFTLCVIFTSCNDFFKMEIKEVPQNYNTPLLSRKAELALWHTTESHETSEDTLQEQVEDWLKFNSENEERSPSVITGVYTYTVTKENGFSSGTRNNQTSSSSPERSDIPFYVFNLENQVKGTNGFAFTCGDPRIGGLLALVENGDFFDTENPFLQIFLGCLDEYIDETISLYNGINDSDINEILSINNNDISRSSDKDDPDDIFFEQIRFDKIYENVEIKTVPRWHQRAPYNWVLNRMAGRLDKNADPYSNDKDEASHNWRTGCAATAMGMLMSYYEWPLKPPTTIRQSAWNVLWYSFNGTAKSSFIDPFTERNTYFSNITYDWNGIKDKPKWYWDDIHKYNDDELMSLMHIGVLMLAIGDKTNMIYSTNNGSGALQSGVIDAFENLGYNRPTEESYNFSKVRALLRESKPIMMGGSEGELFEASGHYWIIDGYRIADVTAISSNVLIKRENFVHCVPGWGDSDVGWYYSGIFDMATGPVARSSARNAKDDMYYRKNLHIFTNLYPNNNKVTLNEINGIYSPVAGFVPKPYDSTVNNITETDQFTGTFEWFKVTSTGELSEIAVGEKFVAGIVYTAVISMTHKTGFSFHGVAANSFIVNGAVSSNNIVNSGFVTAVFPPAINLFASGSGTPGSPFIINTAEQLHNLRKFSSAHFELRNNINLQNVPWTPISEFNGTLDGNGYTISNLNMTFTNGVSGNYYSTDRISFGLFAINKGTIRDLKVSANINLTNIPGNYSLPQDTEISVGVISAANDGTIQNCTVSSSNSNPMINSTIHTGNVAGGITGYNYNKIISCTNNGTIHTSLTTGGIIGCNIGTTKDSDNNALIRYTYNNKNNAIGGIVGVNLLGDIESGTNNGTITYANSSSTSQLIQPAIGHIAGSNSSGYIPSGFLNFSSGTVNIGTLQTTGSHNQALYAGNRALGKGYIGGGTESNPFIIVSEENLRTTQQLKNGYYKLMNNIDLQNLPWTPLAEFTGFLDGNGYTISNLNMNFTNSLLVDNKSISYGLFAKNSGTIHNLRVTASINLTNIPGNYSLPQNNEITVGVIAAENYGTIQHSFVSASSSNPMINSTIHVKNITGGITGNNYSAGKITSCTNNGAVYSNGAAGGIIGYNQGTSSGCTNNALIRYTYVSMNRGIGGIIGENVSGSVTSGTNIGTISYANSASTSTTLQPAMAHIVGHRSNGTVSGTFTISSGSVNTGTLQSVTYTSGSVTQTHNQALYAGSRVIGRDNINGSGTASSPYIITSESHLIYLRQFSNAHFSLSKSIDMSTLGAWTPIPEFTGTFNGNNYIISNLKMTFSNGIHKTINYRDCISYGLFVHNKGTIQNLKVTANIDLTNIASNYSLPQDREIIVGVIAAINDGLIQNTRVSASSSNPMINSTIHVRTLSGGIAGYNDNNGRITSCTNNGTIQSSGTTGGIMGCNIGVSSGCINNGTIRYTYTNHNSGIGGIAGGNLIGFLLSGTNNGSIVYVNASSTSQLIQPSMGHIAGSTSSAYIPINSFNFSGGTVNIGALQTVESHNQALYAGNRALGRGYIYNGNSIIRIP